MEPSLYQPKSLESSLLSQPVEHVLKLLLLLLLLWIILLLSELKSLMAKLPLSRLLLLLLLLKLLQLLELGTAEDVVLEVPSSDVQRWKQAEENKFRRKISIKLFVQKIIEHDPVSIQVSLT